MAALLAESLEQAGQMITEEHKGLANRYAPYRAAKLEGKKFAGKKKGGKAIQSTFGLGFDAQTAQKETPKELETRLNKQADNLAKLNRRIMSGPGNGNARSVMAAAARGLGTMGFVAAATADEKPTLPKPQIDSDSDEDLFAPGVTAAVGAGPSGPGGPGGPDADDDA